MDHRGNGNRGLNPKDAFSVFIVLICLMSVAAALIICQCLLATWCPRRRIRLHIRVPAPARPPSLPQQVPLSSSNSAAQLIPAAAGAARAYEKGGEGTCAVCLADFEEGEAVRVLPECAHCFHVACIDAWLRARTSCPVCRAEMAPPAVQARHVEGGDSLPHHLPLGAIL